MGVIADEKVVAFRIDMELVCRECATDEEEKSVELEQVVLADALEYSEDWLFCDRCKSRIK